jgi:hypothetical protein
MSDGSKPPFPDWLKPLWVRVAFIVLAGAWSAFEFVSGQTIWGVLFGAAAVWGVYQLILSRPGGR